MINEIAITVLMPAYNAGKYISEAIQSVLEQTFIHLELLIINDGSTDETENIISSFSDNRIVLINISHSGISAALNIGLKHARGKYVARFDADDICLPGRLQKQFEFLEAYPEYILTGSDAEYILENGDFLFHFDCIAHRHDEILRKLYFYCPFIHSSVMYKKEAVMQCGGYSEHAHHFEDYLLWLKLSTKGKFNNMADTLIKVRLNSSSATIDEKWRGKKFRDLKRKIIHRGNITEQEGAQLLKMLQRQNRKEIKVAAYHALCGKKFLANNYQPEKARMQIKEAISIRPFRFDNYALLIASYFPEKIIKWLHEQSPNRL